MGNEKCSYGTNKIQFNRKYFWPVKVYMWEVEDASAGKVLALLEIGNKKGARSDTVWSMI